MHKISSAALYTVINRESKTNGAHFTIRSIKTGKDFTYKITRSEFKEKWYTHIHIEIGYLEFVRLCTYSDGKITNKSNAVGMVRMGKLLLKHLVILKLLSLQTKHLELQKMLSNL